MYAVFQTGGKQYRAKKGDVLRVEKIDAEEGAIVNIDHVLMIADGDKVKVGAPLIAGGQVSVKVRSQGRAAKIRIIKHRRRKHFHKEQGHRQYYTEIQITDIAGA
jgi:large subunit ribosomal protein L21